MSKNDEILQKIEVLKQQKDEALARHAAICDELYELGYRPPNKFAKKP